MKPAKPEKPTILREVEHGLRVRLVDGRVLWVTAECTGDVYARRVIGQREEPLQWYSGALAVAEVIR